MRRWLRYLPLLLLIPLIDAVFLVVIGVVLQTYVGLIVSAVTLVGVVVLTALVGGLLVRAEGRRTVRRFAQQLGAGQLPTNELLDGAFLIAAGAFLLTPGLVTDGLGFLFTLPASRVPIRTALKRWVIVPYLDEKTDGFVTGTVYTGGFPGGNGQGPAGHTIGARFGHGSGAESSGSDGAGTESDGAGTAYDLDSDAYEIDIEDVRDEGSSGPGTGATDTGGDPDGEHQP